MAQSFLPVGNTVHMRVTPYKVATSQTIAVGDPVELNASGLVIVGTATSAKLIGVAAEACTSAAAGTVIGVYDDPKQVYKGKCDNSAQAVQAIVGDTVDIVGSTGAFLLNLDATSINVVRVVNLGSNVDPLQDGVTPGTSAATVFFEIALHTLNS